eukprot:22039-Chlamydomonas_euryale.AAC.2
MQRDRPTCALAELPPSPHRLRPCRRHRRRQSGPRSRGAALPALPAGRHRKSRHGRALENTPPNARNLNPLNHGHEVHLTVFLGLVLTRSAHAQVSSLKASNSNNPLIHPAFPIRRIIRPAHARASPLPASASRAAASRPWLLTKDVNRGVIPRVRTEDVVPWLWTADVYPSVIPGCELTTGSITVRAACAGPVPGPVP